MRSYKVAVGITKDLCKLRSKLFKQLFQVAPAICVGRQCRIKQVVSKRVMWYKFKEVNRLPSGREGISTRSMLS